MRKDKIITALVLLLAMMPVSIVKVAHFHELEVAMESHQDIPEHSDSGHCEDTCPICHFVATPFVGTPVLRLDVICTLIFEEPEVEPRTGIRPAETLAHSLRAPPVIFS